LALAFDGSHALGDDKIGVFTGARDDADHVGMHAG
jgi:hypothetical protein